MACWVKLRIEYVTRGYPVLGVNELLALSVSTAGLAAVIVHVAVSVPLVVTFFGKPVGKVIVLFANVPPLFVT